jgi:transketolase
VPIIAVHLTRPPVEIPDREALGMAPHFDASKGAYLIKDYNSDKEKEGVVIVRGTSSTNSVVSILPQLKENGPNIKIVAAISWGLFQLQPKTYRDSIMTAADWYDSMIITNSARRLMQKWTSNRIVHEYTLSPDWDNRWRTGGSLNEIVAEAQLDPESVLKGIKTFGRNRKKRLSKIKSEIPEN